MHPWGCGLHPPLRYPPVACPIGMDVVRLTLGEEKGGGAGTQKFVYPKWPDQIFPFVEFPHDGHFGVRGSNGCRPF